jgi:hypothetical protein
MGFSGVAQCTCPPGTAAAAVTQLCCDVAPSAYICCCLHIDTIHYLHRAGFSVHSCKQQQIQQHTATSSHTAPAANHNSSTSTLLSNFTPKLHTTRAV